MSLKCLNWYQFKKKYFFQRIFIHCELDLCEIHKTIILKKNIMLLFLFHFFKVKKHRNIICTPESFNTNI